jgi:pimeloyl-ACP methyl ester carboxylesterase
MGQKVQEAVFASVRATPVDALVGALEGMRHIDVGQLLAAYHGPCIAIAAADIESPASLHVQFPELATKKIAGTGHWLTMDKPEEFDRALDAFLASMGP